MSSHIRQWSNGLGGSSLHLKKIYTSSYAFKVNIISYPIIIPFSNLSPSSKTSTTSVCPSSQSVRKPLPRTRTIKARRQTPAH
jgi:hypothetical protein